MARCPDDGLTCGGADFRFQELVLPLQLPLEYAFSTRFTLLGFQRFHDVVEAPLRIASMAVSACVPVMRSLDIGWISLAARSSRCRCPGMTNREDHVERPGPAVDPPFRTRSVTSHPSPGGSWREGTIIGSSSDDQDR